MWEESTAQTIQYVEVGPVKVDTGDNIIDFVFVAFFIIMLFVIQLLYWKITGKDK